MGHRAAETNDDDAPFVMLNKAISGRPMEV